MKKRDKTDVPKVSRPKKRRKGATAREGWGATRREKKVWVSPGKGNGDQSSGKTPMLERYQFGSLDNKRGGVQREGDGGGGSRKEGGKTSRESPGASPSQAAKGRNCAVGERRRWLKAIRKEN